MAKMSLATKSALLTLVIGIAVLMLLPAGSVLGGATLSASRATVPSGLDIAMGSSDAAPASTTGVPLSPTTPSTAPSIYAGIPASLEKIPWIASLTHTGPQLGTLASVPNLELLKHPATVDAQGTINPFYVQQPAPLGITDNGLGATPYSYNTSHIMGEVTFNTPPNVTDPGSSDVIAPAGQHDGYVGSVYEFGIQLNTVATNISIPGSDQGFFWTQNVVNFNDTGIHFVDDTFNATSATQNPFYIAAGTIYTACGYQQPMITQVLKAYGGVFQCVGGTIPLSPASYPVTVQLYNNATINKDDRTVVSYGYRFIMHGTGLVYTGVASDVVFNNPAAPGTRPANPPGFSVDAFAPAPAGIFRDAEIDLVGDIGGDNSVFRSINGSMALEYSNRSAGGWQSVPSAYDFGTDTGETSTGIAETWTAGHTVNINQGPAMLYGLWNAVPYASVPSGAIHVSGAITPSYGFVFVSNTPPVLDPWNASLGERDNTSWLPTTDAGTFSTYLPPTGSAWTSAYYVEAFADGYATAQGPTITATVSSYDLHLALSPGTLDAPLYAFSNAQESALAAQVTGSASPPYTYSDLSVDMNLSFEHVNDYGYPTFVVFMAQGVTNPIIVDDVYQGEDSPAGNYAMTDYGYYFEEGLLESFPAFFPAPYYTSGINIYGGAHDQVFDQTTAEDGYNLQLILWGDRDPKVWGITSIYGSSGVFLGETVNAQVWNVTSSWGATAVTDESTTATHGWNIVANGADLGAIGVYALSSVDPRYDYVGAYNDAAGIVAGAWDNPDTGAIPYYWLPGTIGLAVTGLSAYNGSEGANISLSDGTTISNLAVWGSSLGVIFGHSADIAVSDVAAWDLSIGVATLDSSYVSVTQLQVWDGSVGVIAVESTVLRVTHVVDRRNSVGVELIDSSWAFVKDVKAERQSVGVYLDGAKHVTLEHIHAYDDSIAVVVA